MHVSRQSIVILISASVLSFCGDLHAQTPDGLPKQTDGSYIAAYRTPAHVRYSKPDVFHGIVDQLVEFLNSHRVVLVSDPARKMIQSEDVMSRETLLNVTKDVGASHLLYLIVDRPTTQWVKITLECFDVSGKLIWEESVGSGMGGVSGQKGVSRTLEKLEKQLMPRMGQPGLAYVDEDVQVAMVGSPVTLDGLGSLPDELHRAEAAIEAAEAYEEFTSDEDVPPLPKKNAAEKEPPLREGLSRADADLTRYLKKNPRDAHALLLQVRLDEVKGQVFPLGYDQGGITRRGMPGPERDPQETLDLILQIDPQNAEAYYRQARYWGMLRVNFTSNHKSMRQADFAKASRFARMAAERAPENVEYRETLATYLNAEGKAAEAMEALKPLQGANDPRCRLLIDETKISVPEGSVFDTDRVELLLPLAQDENLDFPALRLRAFLYPGPLSKVQEYYQQRWNDFRLQKKLGGDVNDNSTLALFEWQGDTLQFSPEPPTEANTKKAEFLLIVGELKNLTNAVKERLFWQELLDNNPSDVACLIIMVNRRRF
jgi:hypothetical protein